MEYTQISFEEFSKVEIKVGRIIAAEKIEGSEKLIKLQIDFGTHVSTGLPHVRTILSGVVKTYSPDQMIGKQVPVVMNLAPRMIMGVESQGMVLFAIDETLLEGLPSHKTIMIHPEVVVPLNSAVQ